MKLTYKSNRNNSVNKNMVFDASVQVVKSTAHTKPIKKKWTKSEVGKWTHKYSENKIKSLEVNNLTNLLSSRNI